MSQIAVRRTGLDSAMERAGLVAVAAVAGPNLVYLSGLDFHLSERPVFGLFVKGGPDVLVHPALEATKVAASELSMHGFAYTDEAGPSKAVAEALAHAQVAGRRVGVEGRRMRFLELDLMAHSGHQPELWAADEVFAELRMQKQSSELEAMRLAVGIAEAAFESVRPQITAGVTERQVAAQLVMALLAGGSDPELPFLPIVLGGANAANPHGVPSDRPFEAGDWVVVDWGARSAGYCSDITRMVLVEGGTPDPALRRALDVVIAANTAARAAVRPGALAGEVDAAARQVITAAGLGEYFIHRTGHGLGLECHEEPDMKAGSKLRLAPGMTFTVEPGVYLPGIGGVRIEDDVVVTPTGAETLTGLERAVP